jgi:astacin
MSGEFSSSPNTSKGRLYLANSKRIKDIEYAMVDGRAIFEGDIAIDTTTDIEEMSRLASIGVFNNRWRNGVVPYSIHPTMPDTERVTEAIQHWMQHTEISFVERQTENDYIEFMPSNKSWSYIGRIGGRQEIELANTCSTGTVIHEIGHAVGLWHEQDREDRNKHVRINWENIRDNHEHIFKQRIVDGDDVGLYDFVSIMHYPRKAYTKNGQDTITPLEPGVIIGQRERLSGGDIAAVKHLYRLPWLQRLMNMLRNLLVDWWR